MLSYAAIIDVKNADSKNKYVKNAFFILKNFNKRSIKKVDIDVSEIIVKCCTWVSMSMIYCLKYYTQNKSNKLKLAYKLDWLFGDLKIYFNKKWQEV